MKNESQFNDSPVNAKSVSVAAVVVTYNRDQLLKQVLSAIKNQTYPVSEIVVVDNATSITTQKMISKHFPHITYLKMSDNLGSAGGLVAGMKMVYDRGYDWIWSCNDDASPKYDALECCLNVAEALKVNKVAIVSPARRGNKREFGFGSLWRGRQLNLPKDSQSKSWYDVDISGSLGALLARDAVQKVGYPRADFFMEFWETEYSLRLKAAGFRIIKIPLVCFDHMDDRQGVSVPWRGCYYLTRNWLVMAIEHRSLSELWWWAIQQLKAITATILYRSNKVECLRLRFLGIWHGMRGKMGRTIDPKEYWQKKRKPT